MRLLEMEPNEVEAWKFMMDSLIESIHASTEQMNTINQKASNAIFPQFYEMEFMPFPLKGTQKPKVCAAAAASQPKADGSENHAIRAGPVTSQEIANLTELMAEKLTKAQSAIDGLKNELETGKLQFMEFTKKSNSAALYEEIVKDTNMTTPRNVNPTARSTSPPAQFTKRALVPPACVCVNVPPTLPMAQSQFPRQTGIADAAASSGSLIVVSNRLPFVLQRNQDGKLVRKASAGGLVTAVAPVVINSGGLWVGWPGIHLQDPNEPIPESDPTDITPTADLRSEKVVAVQMDPAVFDSYYNGCCNAIFWPLFHSMPDRASFKSEHWRSYVKANKVFAECTMKALTSLPKASADVPLIWIHDYHLLLAANWIKQAADEQEIKCKLGFFLHIPFPSWDICRLLPWADEVLQGMLGNDMVGFHITDYCLNFIDCCQRCLGCRVDRKNLLVEHGDRTVRVQPLPISIPFKKFVELADKAPRVLPTNQKMILGVDRLDYTKGLLHRLRAYEKLLVDHPEHIEKVLLLQICVPSRTDVKEYQDLKKELDQLVGTINGRFTTPNWSPIRYIFGQVSQDELAAFYRDSAVGLVTPLRDGMNLVAKEFVACQINIPPGVLIVSPFAGAGETMHEALISNPYEIDDASEVINKALTMPEDEKIQRMNSLRRREERNDVDSWKKLFFKAMRFQ